MSDAYPLAKSQGTGGTAVARAREQTDQSAQDARERRVAELRRQYLAGEYQVNAQELSAALIRQHLAESSVLPPAKQ